MWWTIAPYICLQYPTHAQQKSIDLLCLFFDIIYQEQKEKNYGKMMVFRLLQQRISLDRLKDFSEKMDRVSERGELLGTIEKGQFMEFLPNTTRIQCKVGLISLSWFQCMHTQCDTWKLCVAFQIAFVVKAEKELNVLYMYDPKQYKMLGCLSSPTKTPPHTPSISFHPNIILRSCGSRKLWPKASVVVHAILCQVETCALTHVCDCR